MASSDNKNNPQNYLGSTSGNLPSGSDTPSRLTESTEALRSTLLSRNLYTEFTSYPLQPNTRQKIVNSIGSIVDTVLPFKSVNLADSAFSRLISTPNTPLVDVGLIMLGKQFAQNFQSNLAQELIPTVNIRNMFDGNPDTKLFQKKIKFNITRKTEGGTLDNFVEDFFGYQPKRDNVFNYKTTNAEYLENTGVGQIDFLFGNTKFNDNTGGLNKNIYKPSEYAYFKAAKDSDNEIADRVNIVANKRWYTMSYRKFNQYSNYFPTPDSELLADSSMGEAYRIVNDNFGYPNQEYAPDIAFVEDNFGKTEKGRVKEFDPLDNSSLVNEEGFNDSINSQFIWGRDGVSEAANNRLSSLRGVKIDSSGEGDTGSGSVSKQDPKSFNIKTGLLEYTRNLLNASEGQFIDQTRKIYNNIEGFKGMNGSSLWNSNNTDYSEKSGSAGSSGLRQHSVLDQYNRFAKAIRFDGSVHYGGNPNSVVYNNVLPRIHPTIEGDENKNLMFSLENLAIRAFKTDSNVAIIDDEYGTPIPASEVGSSGGRYMWFPPYAIELNEATQANYDSTVMIGRNEPIYSYMNSERSANLSFKLIIDYPEQVKNFLKTASHKDLAEFFAFGGDKYDPNKIRKNEDKSEDDIDDEITTIKGRNVTLLPEVDLPFETRVYFPNNVPSTADAEIIDQMYQGLYEAKKGVTGYTNTGLYDGGTSFGLNAYGIYDMFGITYSGDDEQDEFLKDNNTADIPEDFKQSQAEFVEGKRTLDDDIYNVFKDEDNSKYYKIFITGQATKLYTPEIKNDKDKGSSFNLGLSELRANTVKLFIEERIKKIFGKKAENLGIIIETSFVGSEISSDANDTIESITSLEAKKERSAVIRFMSTGVSKDRKEYNLTPEDQRAVDILNLEKQTIASAKNFQKRNHGSDTMEERSKNMNSDQDQGILGGFKSITDNHFYSAFHSQTPEDFHKRLTFLQQCMRQGSAVRSNPDVDDNGVTRVKNSTFGRQPVCVLRIADFFHTKVIIENLTIDYDDTIWDTNPEGFGMQPMIANVTLQMKVLGGQSLSGPIDALQNAVSFNYYANSTFSDRGGYYHKAVQSETDQNSYDEGLATSRNTENKKNTKRKLSGEHYKRLYPDTK